MVTHRWPPLWLHLLGFSLPLPSTPAGQAHGGPVGSWRCPLSQDPPAQVQEGGPHLGFGLPLLSITLLAADEVAEGRPGIPAACSLHPTRRGGHRPTLYQMRTGPLTSGPPESEKVRRFGSGSWHGPQLRAPGTRAPPRLRVPHSQTHKADGTTPVPSVRFERSKTGSFPGRESAASLGDLRSLRGSG